MAVPVALAARDAGLAGRGRRPGAPGSTAALDHEGTVAVVAALAGLRRVQGDEVEPAETAPRQAGTLGAGAAEKAVGGRAGRVGRLTAGLLAVGVGSAASPAPAARRPSSGGRPSRPRVGRAARPACLQVFPASVLNFVIFLGQRYIKFTLSEDAFVLGKSTNGKIVAKSETRRNR